MFRLLQWCMSGGVVLAAAGYFFILPQLGQDTLNVDTVDLVGDPVRGEYVLRMGACISCHSDEENDSGFLAGGPALETPFGTFYGPNITPDPEHGIGGMTTQEFFDAVTAGLRPDGKHYYPAFPYASYASMNPQDVVDLKAYLDTVPSIAKAARAHEIIWPITDRSLIGGWKLFAYTAKEFVPDEQQDDAWNRGKYLVEGPGHCGECHTKRNLLGLPTGQAHGGAGEGSFSSGAPSIAGSNSTISQWTSEDTAFYLESGMKPDGDVSGGKMTDVIDTATSYLSIEDLDAISAYFVSLQEPASQ